MENALTGEWLVDGRVRLDEVAADADWNRLAIIRGLEAEGLAASDAEAYADFIISEAAEVSDTRPEDCVTDAQWDRLS